RTYAKTQVLKHLVLQSFRLQPQRVPERACTSPQQIELGAPVEPIPLRQHRFAMTQLGLPLPPPIGPQAARHDHAEERNQSEMRPSEDPFVAREQRHGFDLMRVTAS